MAAEWKEYKLGELCYSVSETYRRHDDKVVLINTSDVLNGKILNHEEVENKNLKGQFKKTFKQNDILYSEIRPANKRFAYVDIENPFNYIASTKLMVLRSTDKILPKFLFILLTSEQIITYLQAMAETRSGTFPQITYGAELAPIIVNVPDIETQEKIVKILSALDEKIELNNKINENLHAQAQAIFKSWFVDFEPFGGTMPIDWEEGKLSDVADIIMGQSPKGESYNEIGDGEIFYQGKADFTERFPVRRLYTTEPKRMAEEKSVLLSVRAPVGEINVATEKCCIGRGLASIKSKKRQNSYLLYLLYSIQSQFDIFNGEGTVFGSINKSDLGNMNIVLPAQEKISQFEKIASQLDEMILTNWNENQKLAQIRDTLLPKLMSGELEV